MNSCLRLWTCQTDTTPPSPPVSRYWPSRLRSTACERWSENFLLNSSLPSCKINYLPASSVKCPTKVKLKGFQLGSVCINCLWISRWSGGSLSLPSKQSSHHEVERSDKKKISGQRRHPEGFFCTQTPTRNKDGSPQRGPEIYSSHLLFLQTVAAERVPRDSHVHKSSRVLESIKSAAHSGSWNWTSREHQSASNRSRWNDEAEC